MECVFGAIIGAGSTSCRCGNDRRKSSKTSAKLRFEQTRSYDYGIEQQWLLMMWMSNLDRLFDPISMY